jgi:transcriptional regulator with XRE-family HTH domain
VSGPRRRARKPDAEPPRSPEAALLGRVIRTARGEMSQDEVVARVRSLLPDRKTNRSAISYIENGTGNPRLALLLAIAKVLHHEVLVVPSGSADALAARLRELDDGVRGLLLELIELMRRYGTATIIRNLKIFVRTLREDLTEAEAATPGTLQPGSDQAGDRR